MKPNDNGEIRGEWSITSLKIELKIEAGDIYIFPRPIMFPQS